MRGEKIVFFNNTALQQGSPPHARGKAKIADDKAKKQRITPACAGKSKVKGGRLREG